MLAVLVAFVLALNPVFPKTAGDPVLLDVSQPFFTCADLVRAGGLEHEHPTAFGIGELYTIAVWLEESRDEDHPDPEKTIPKRHNLVNAFADIMGCFPGHVIRNP